MAADAAASMAQFVLPPGQVSSAVVHRTVTEYWYVISGHGTLWRRLDDDSTETRLAAGLSLTLPVGTAFQFRNDANADLRILGLTTPPWPGADEATPVPGAWPPTNA